MKATDELLKEHEGIQVMLRILQALAVQYGRGEAPPEEDVNGILEFLVTFVDRCHHGKEEEFLFPAVEAAGMPREDGPIGVLLEEHRQGRRLVARLGETTSRCASGDPSAAASAQQAIGDYVALLSEHIAKENAILFPMADSRLGSVEDDALFEAFERLERDRIGVGKHEQFHAMLDRLRESYLADESR